MSVRGRSYLVGAIVVLAMAGAFAAVAWRIGAFADMSPSGMMSVVFGLLCLALTWTGVTRIVDPSRPLTTTKYERERMIIGGVDQYVTRNVGRETGVMDKRAIYGFSIIGLLGYFGCFALMLAAPGSIEADRQTRAEIAKQYENPLASATTLAGAYDATKHALVDDQKDGDFSTGVTGIWDWGREHLTWEMVANPDAATATTVAKIQLDPAAERGKRLCVTGRVFEAKPFVILAVSETETVTALWRGKHTLTLDAPVRFCGIALGRHDMTFTSRGPKRTALILGMFDPATVEAAPVEKPAP